jgi:hypothetical protein
VALAVLRSSSSVESDRHQRDLRRANGERWVLRRGKNVSCLIAHRAVRRPVRSAEQASAARADLRRDRAAEANDAASSKRVSWTYSDAGKTPAGNAQWTLRRLETGQGSKEQLPSMGCSIKWKH